MSGATFHDPADLTDGHGNEWQRCGRPDCGLHVVRPGRVQCNTDDCPNAPQTAA